MLQRYLAAFKAFHEHPGMCSAAQLMTLIRAGVTSDIGKIRETMDGESHPALLLVDGVSSIGGLNFEFDKWKVDVAITGSQKALSLPTGLSVLAVSDKVGFYFMLAACCSP